MSVRRRWRADHVTPDTTRKWVEEMKYLTLGRRQEVDLGRGVHGALVGQDVWRERHGQLRVEQLQPLPLGRQAEDLVLEPLVLLLQGVERLEHLHDCKGQGGNGMIGRVTGLCLK